MSQLRNQGIIRCAISCNGKVIGQNHHQQKRCIEPAFLINRGPEHQHCGKCQRQGRPFQEWNSPSIFGCTPVRPGRDHRICKSIKNSPEGCDSSDNSENAKHHQSLWNKYVLPLADGGFIWLIKIHKPV